MNNYKEIADHLRYVSRSCGSLLSVVAEEYCINLGIYGQERARFVRYVCEKHEKLPTGKLYTDEA